MSCVNSVEKSRTTLEDDIKTDFVWGNADKIYIDQDRVQWGQVG